MASCEKNIQDKIISNEINDITELLPNTITNIAISNINKQLFRLEISKQETVLFQLNLISQQNVSNIGVTVNFYSFSNDSFQLLGTVLITEMNTTFQKDLDDGSYLICIGSSRFTFTGNIVGVFTGYTPYAKLVVRGYAGQTFELIGLTTVEHIRTCNRVIFQKIIAGSLPENLTLNASGLIEGVLPDMDCTAANDALSPAQNWYYNINNVAFPWGRQFRFQVMAWLQDFPEVTATRWFCISIHNNWSRDRDNFIQQPIDHPITTITEKPRITLSNDMFHEKKKTTAVDIKTIDMTDLCPCESATAIEQSLLDQFAAWYEKHKDYDRNDPTIISFIERFKQSEKFQQMAEKIGLFEPETMLPISDNILQHVHDIDYIMSTMKDEVNQSLPITLESFHGTVINLSIELRE